MRPVTVVAALLVVLSLGGVAAVGLTDGGGSLDEKWVSDTPRDTQTNHHAVGVGPDGDLVVAPVALPAKGTPAPDACSLVRLGTDGAVQWRANVDPANCTSHALTEPAIGDVDDDGEREVVVATTERALITYSADGREESRVPLSTYGYGRPTIADLTGDDGPEVVASSIDGGVVVTNRGGVVWRKALDTRVFEAPVVGDVDGDGAREVLVGTGEGPVLLSAEGGVKWRAPGKADTMATGDVDGDGTTEAFTTWTRTVRAYDVGEGVAWTRSFGANPTVHSVSAERGAVYAAFTDGSVRALDTETGETRWSTSVTAEESQFPPPVLGDVDGDGDDELVVVTNAGTVTVLDPASGETLATYERDVRVWTFPTLTDIDDDGAAEVLVRYGDGRVIALDYADDDGPLGL